jgi:hypothetical protein
VDEQQQQRPRRLPQAALPAGAERRRTRRARDGVPRVARPPHWPRRWFRAQATRVDCASAATGRRADAGRDAAAVRAAGQGAAPGGVETRRPAPEAGRAGGRSGRGRARRAARSAAASASEVQQAAAQLLCAYAGAWSDDQLAEVRSVADELAPLARAQLAALGGESASRPGRRCRCSADAEARRRQRNRPRRQWRARLQALPPRLRTGRIGRIVWIGRIGRRSRLLPATTAPGLRADRRCRS